MKVYHFLLAGVSIASAIVVPNEQVLSDPAIDSDEDASPFVNLLSLFEDGIHDALSSGIDPDAASSDLREVYTSTFDDADDRWVIDDFEFDIEDNISDDGHGKRPHQPPHPSPPRHAPSNLTIYQLIERSKHTTKLAKLVDEDEALVELLNSTNANYTVFAPTDYAFSKIPRHAPKPSKELIRHVLLYHIAPGLYPTARIFHSHTLPTLFNESSLGKDLPQRVVVRAGLRGLKVNFHSRIVASNIPAVNGIVHGIDTILLPPPRTSIILNLLPTEFSTFTLGLTKTDLLPFPSHKGGTIFAPLNSAFRKLGPRVNAFLFSQHGKKYLRALLKYHLSQNQTLYSDVLYMEDGKIKPFGPRDFAHIDLPTLLQPRHLAIDIVRFGPWAGIRINGFQHVTFEDGIASDGVLQVVRRVLIPPKQDAHVDMGEGDWVDDVEGELSVEDLVERLDLSGLVED